MEWIYLIAGVVFAYLIGSFSSAVWISRWFFGMDVREKGSGNAGATNTIRVLGVLPGIIVLLLDAFKGVGAVLLAPCFFSQNFPQEYEIYYKVLASVFVLLGHVYPLYTNFKGGKGVATMAGVVAALFPKAFFLAFLIFVLVFLVTRYVSLSSMFAGLSFPVSEYFLFGEARIFLLVFASLIAVFVLYTHRKNIVRLRKGEEPKFYFKKTL